MFSALGCLGCVSICDWSETTLTLKSPPVSNLDSSVKGSKSKENILRN